MARKFDIPTSFTVKGKKVEVVFDDVFCSGEGLLGEANFTDLVITLSKSWKGHKTRKAVIEDTFFHELAHMLLHFCGKHKQKYDEEFVDDLGLCIRDFFKTYK